MLLFCFFFNSILDMDFKINFYIKKKLHNTLILFVYKIPYCIHFKYITTTDFRHIYIIINWTLNTYTTNEIMEEFTCRTDYKITLKCISFDDYLSYILLKKKQKKLRICDISTRFDGLNTYRNICVIMKLTDDIPRGSRSHVATLRTPSNYYYNLRLDTGPILEWFDVMFFVIVANDFRTTCYKL